MEQLTAVEMDLSVLVSIHLDFRNALPFGSRELTGWAAGT